MISKFNLKTVKPWFFVSAIIITVIMIILFYKIKNIFVLFSVTVLLNYVILISLYYITKIIKASDINSLINKILYFFDNSIDNPEFNNLSEVHSDKLYNIKNKIINLKNKIKNDNKKIIEFKNQVRDFELKKMDYENIIDIKQNNDNTKFESFVKLVDPLKKINSELQMLINMQIKYISKTFDLIDKFDTRAFFELYDIFNTLNNKFNSYFKKYNETINVFENISLFLNKISYLTDKLEVLSINISIDSNSNNTDSYNFTPIYDELNIITDKINSEISNIKNDSLKKGFDNLKGFTYITDFAETAEKNFLTLFNKMKNNFKNLDLDLIKKNTLVFKQNLNEILMIQTEIQNIVNHENLFSD